VGLVSVASDNEAGLLELMHRALGAAA